MPICRYIRIHVSLIVCFVNLCTISENFPYTHTDNFTHTHTCATLWQDAVKLKLKVNTTLKQQRQAAPRLKLNEQRIFSCLFVLSGATTSASLHSTLTLPRYPLLASSLSLPLSLSTLEMRSFCCCCHFLHFVLDINLIYSRISNQNKWKFILKIVFVFSIFVGAARFIFTLCGQQRRSRGLHTPKYFLNNFPFCNCQK